MDKKSQSRLFYGIIIGVFIIGIFGLYFVSAPPDTYFTIVPNASNLAYNGTLNDQTWNTFIGTTPMASADVLKIATHDTTFFKAVGTSANDGFVFVNFTVPNPLTSIQVITWGNISEGTADYIGLAIWNFTNSTWIQVNTSTGFAVANFNLLYTPSTAQLNDFVSNNQIKVMFFESSANARFLWVDYIGLNVSQTIYPTFSDYYDDNASLLDTGTGHFNVTVANTNGTVILHINNTNIYATNLSASNYNVSYNFTHGGNYLYNWTAYGNGLSHNQNISYDRWYTVNSTITSTCTYSSGNWAVDCSENCVISTNFDGGGTGNNFTATGSGRFVMTANLSGFKNYRFSGGCNATCENGGCIRI